LLKSRTNSSKNGSAKRNASWASAKKTYPRPFLNLVKEVGGLKLGLYNVSETMYNKPTESTAGVWLYDESLVREDLLDLRQRCDYLIVLYDILT